MTSEEEDTKPPAIPWAWIKAANHILNVEPPLEEPSTMPIEILPWLYLSDTFHSIYQMDKLAKLGITHVITIHAGNKHPDELTQLRETLATKHNIHHHYVLNARDDERYNFLTDCWDAQNVKDYFQEAGKVENAKVVVHCATGVNRSGWVVAAAMLLFGQDNTTTTTTHYNVLQVLRHLKQKRGVVLTNIVFQNQLCRLAMREGRLGDAPMGYTNDIPTEYVTNNKDDDRTTKKPEPTLKRFQPVGDIPEIVFR